MRIINCGHACFKIIDEGIAVVFDPYKDDSVPGLNIHDKISTNYLFMSHDHFDHNAEEKINLIRIDSKIDVKRILLPHDKCGGKQRGMSFVTVIKFPDYSVCHMGDIGDPKAVIGHDELKNIDVVLCPINGYFTISAEEAIELQKVMGWKLLIPMHYEIKEKGIGYPDGGQIDIFKTKIGSDNYSFIDNYYLDINEDSFSRKSLIFNKCITKGIE